MLWHWFKRSRAKADHKETLCDLRLKMRDIKWALDGRTRAEVIEQKGILFEQKLRLYFARWIAVGVPGPASPDTLLCNGESNPTGVVASPVPYFSAIFRSNLGVVSAEQYRIQVDTDPTFGSPTWDSNWQALSSPCAKDSRCENINYGGTTLPEDGTIFYWRIRFRHTLPGNGGWWTEAWSTEEAYFTMASMAGAPSTGLDTPVLLMLPMLPWSLWGRRARCDAPEAKPMDFLLGYLEESNVTLVNKLSKIFLDLKYGHCIHRSNTPDCNEITCDATNANINIAGTTYSAAWE